MFTLIRQFGAATACAVFLVAPYVQAQESLVKGEALVRLQSIPLSKPMNYEQIYLDDQVELLTLLTTKALDSSAAWNTTSNGWNLYRINLRADLESALRQRVTTSNGTIRTLSQTADTSLAQHYADTLSGAELDQALQFYQSNTGKQYLAYQRALRQAYARGQVAFEQMRLDPSVGAGKSNAELHALWLARNKLPRESTEQAYPFHVKTLQPLFPAVSPQDLAFNLAAGAVPGSEAMKRLDTHFTPEERAQVTQYLASPVAAKELTAIKAWHTKFAKQPEILPMVIGEVVGIASVIQRWRKIRGEPDALPKSMAKIDPASIEVPDSLDAVQLDDSAPDRLKACLPTVGNAQRDQLQKLVSNRDYLRTSTTFSSPDVQAFYTTRGDRGACVRTTAAGYPILGVDSFASTVSIVGMTDAQAQAWRRKIARAIASTGSATALAIADNGNAFEVNFAVEARSPQRMVYYMRFRPKGTYNEADFGIVERGPGLRSVSVTSTTGPDGVQRSSRSVIATAEDRRRDDEARKSP